MPKETWKAFSMQRLQKSPTHHEELAQGDVGENVMGFVFATGDPTLLPEVGELVLQGPTGSQVEDKLPGEMVVQERVVHVGKQPVEPWRRKQSRKKPMRAASARTLVVKKVAK